MKVKQLIHLLSKEDPEAEVIADGPISFIEWKPGYYDGHTPFLIEDESKKPYYVITGYKWEANEMGKVVLHSMDLESCLYNCDDLKELDEFKLEGDQRYIEHGEELRKKVREDFIKMGIK